MKHDRIDLRSDTVTLPDAEMRRAMAEAEVGDDVYGEDPTVTLLEEESAAALGMEAGLFVPSGTMGNQIAMHLLGHRGEEVICDATSHVLLYEMGGMAALSGLMPRPIPSPGGLLDPAVVESNITKDAMYHARTGLITVENTHNMGGGTIYDRPHLDRLVAVARRHDLPIHCDGARIFNPAVALGTTAASLAAGFDSVMFCLSKGLGAPVGSILCGGVDFIREARRVRKMFGGGMRQAGIIAAAGLLALRKGPGRLADDHEKAARLAQALAEVPGLALDADAVRTNIVMFRVTPDLFGGELQPDPAGAFLARLREQGVLGGQFDRERVRLVTHRDLGFERIDTAIERIRQAVGTLVH
ncbi:MAG TPA: low specificity L-threonine aldolase [Thermoanaerobaculia bacterium]|nr:low specificity L-threonine aldolase [Thermoanaerobaculia bacterium]